MDEKSGKKEDQKLKVLNSLLFKKVVDDGDGIAIVGTMVQQVFVDVDKRNNNNASERDILLCKKRHPEKKHKGIAFDYRFNDHSAVDGDHITFRRSEIHETDNEMCFRHTYQVKIPLEINMSFDSVPFKVVCSSSMIELSTLVLDENNEDKDNGDGIKVRPNLTVHKEHKTNMVCIQRDFVKQKIVNYDITSNISSWFCTLFGKLSGHEDKEKMQKVKEAMIKIDRSRKYDFVSPFPHVQYFYDTKKEYCPKFMISFLLVEDGIKKFVEVFFPLFLIGVLNTIHVLSDHEHLIENNEEVDVTDARYLKATSNNEPVSTTDYLANSATLTLAVILLLPNVMSTSFIQSFWTTNNLFIIIILSALGLSSIPYQLAKTRALAYTGMGLYWTSYFLPFLNLFQYYRFFQHRREEHDENTNYPEYYMEESMDQQFKLNGNKSTRDDLMTVEEACKSSKSMLDEVDAVKLTKLEINKKVDSEKSSDSKSKNLMGYQCRYMDKKVCKTRKKGRVHDCLCINKISTEEGETEARTNDGNNELLLNDTMDSMSDEDSETKELDAKMDENNNGNKHCGDSKQKENEKGQSDKKRDENDTGFMVLEYIYEEDSKKMM